MSAIQGGLTGMESAAQGLQDRSHARQPSHSAMQSSGPAQGPNRMEALAGSGTSARMDSATAQAGQEQKAAGEETESKVGDQAANELSKQEQPSGMLPEDSTLRQMQMNKMGPGDSAQQTENVQEIEEGQQDQPGLGRATQMADSLPGLNSGGQHLDKASSGGLFANNATFAGQTGQLLSRTI
ncbi:MAG: hypothetical protein R6U22_11950 [Desulfohalobiaceae bacterium]